MTSTTKTCAFGHCSRRATHVSGISNKALCIRHLGTEARKKHRDEQLWKLDDEQLCELGKEGRKQDNWESNRKKVMEMKKHHEKQLWKKLSKLKIGEANRRPHARRSKL